MNAYNTASDIANPSTGHRLADIPTHEFGSGLRPVTFNSDGFAVPITVQSLETDELCPMSLQS